MHLAYRFRSRGFPRGIIAAVMVGSYAYLSRERVQACSIVGYLGEDPAIDFLLHGLQILQNRGYDSAGIASIDHRNQLWITKHASQITTSDALKRVVDEASRHTNHRIGIGHTRWATHGAATDINAHPHSDEKNRIALVHNGTIENSATLRRKLVEEGILCRSETDTEVIAQLIGVSLNKGLGSLDAVKEAIAQLEGTWGLAVIHRDEPDQMILARKGSPLCVGIRDRDYFVASEVGAFTQYTAEYIALQDGEIAVIRRDGSTLDLSRKERAPQEAAALSPHPFQYWTRREIQEQPEAVRRLLNAGVQPSTRQISTLQHIILTGCGTSLYACNYGASLLRSHRIFGIVQCFDSAEMTIDHLPQKAGIIAISQSGETRDVIRTVNLSLGQGLRCFSIINQMRSLLDRLTTSVAYLHAGKERAVASTKAFTNQVTSLALITSELQNRESPELLESLEQLPSKLEKTLLLEDQCRAIAQRIEDTGSPSLFILGKGYAESIAHEGALKIKEIAYLHAEGYSGGALKHGPFALLSQSDRTPVILLILDDQHGELMKIAAQEVKARGAHTIIITDRPHLGEEIADDLIIIPTNGPLTALLGVVPLQLIAYHLALVRGINPDYPRNLAKAVTTD